MEPALVPDDGIPLNSRLSVPPTEQGHPQGALYRHGMLVVFLGIFGYYVHWLANVPPHYPYDRYGLGILTVSLVLNHLTFSFRWSRRTSRVMRVFSFGGLALAVIWLVWLGPHLFPLARS